VDSLASCSSLYRIGKDRIENTSPNSQSQSYSYFVNGGLSPISSSCCHAPLDPRPEFFFYWTLEDIVPYLTSSLTRGCVCRLQLPLVLDRAAILWIESRGTHDHISLSDSRLSQPGRPGPRIYMPQEQGGPLITPGTGFPFRRLLRLTSPNTCMSSEAPEHKVAMAFNYRRYISLQEFGESPGRNFILFSLSRHERDSADCVCADMKRNSFVPCKFY
jgi:hypothetical protein